MRNFGESFLKRYQHQYFASVTGRLDPSQGSGHKVDGLKKIYTFMGKPILKTYPIQPRNTP
jgi:hypothetical protein